MRKFAVFSATLFISIVLAGLYGILHDQITYSIAPEYFTKFKYGQFGFEPQRFGGHRPTVAGIYYLIRLNKQQTETADEAKRRA